MTEIEKLQAEYEIIHRRMTRKPQPSKAEQSRMAERERDIHMRLTELGAKMKRSNS